jgi:hypothetical protein
MDFHPTEQRMRLRSVHPGVSLEQVREATGFELIIEGDVPETEPPSTEEVGLIRELDPTGARKREFPAA